MGEQMTYTHEIRKRKNSVKFTAIASFESETEIISYLKQNNLSYVSSPYVFTYIQLSDGSIIRQTYMGMICSPTKLRDLIKTEVIA